MTTIRQLITDGFREGGLIATDAEPEAAESAEALRKLNSLYRSFFGTELGDPLTTINYGDAGLTNQYAINEDLSGLVTDAYCPVNTRLVFNNNAPVTVFLHPNPEDGARAAIIDNTGNFATYNVILNGNGRQIELTNSVTLNTNKLAREWFYRADTGNWVKVTDLGYDDESPLPVEFDDLISTAMAVRLNPRYGNETGLDTAGILTRMKKIFRSRYTQTTEQSSEFALRRLPSRRHSIYYGASKTTFDRGTP